MWVPISSTQHLKLFDQYYEDLKPIVLRENFADCPDGTKYFLHRIMEWRFKTTNKPLLKVETKDNIHYFYVWRD